MSVSSQCIERASFSFDYKIVTKTLTLSTLNSYHPTSILLKYKLTESTQTLEFCHKRPVALTSTNHYCHIVTIWLITNWLLLIPNAALFQRERDMMSHIGTWAMFFPSKNTTKKICSNFIFSPKSSFI